MKISSIGPLTALYKMALKNEGIHKKLTLILWEDEESRNLLGTPRIAMQTP
jgi:hypothetical protein